MGTGQGSLTGAGFNNDVSAGREEGGGGGGGGVGVHAPRPAPICCVFTHFQRQITTFVMAPFISPAWSGGFVHVIPLLPQSTWISCDFVFASTLVSDFISNTVHIKIPECEIWENFGFHTCSGVLVGIKMIKHHFYTVLNLSG